MSIAYVYHLRHVIYMLAALATLAVAFHHWRGSRALAERASLLEDMRRAADEIAKAVTR